MKENRGYTGYQSDSLPKARQLRKNMTKQERRLWFGFLKNYPIKIYKQRPIDRYIADFYCSSAHLVIELDGNQHYTEEGLEHDRIRTEIMEKYGLMVLRFSNLDVDRDFESVCTVIDNTIKSRRKQPM